MCSATRRAPHSSSRRCRAAGTGSPRRSPNITNPRRSPVFPFANLNQDPAFDYFADGVTDVLITQLGSIGTMRVISRQSTLQFRSTSGTIESIARMLGVDVLVEGSVLRHADRVRVTAQLLQAEPERHLWAHAYECALADVLAAQQQLASAIATQVNQTLRADTVARLPSSSSPGAHEAYLKGRFHAAAWSRDGFEKGIWLFQQAVTLDPGFALAYAGLAHAYTLAGYWNHLPAADAYASARRAAVRALELDATLSDAHAALSWVVLWQDWNLESSERERVRAIELNPSNETARMQHALDAATIRQDCTVALTEMREALRLDPLSVMTGAAAAWVLFFVRRFNEAAEQARATLDMHPTSLQSWYVLGLARCVLGRLDEAVAALERAVEISSVPLSLAYLGWVCAAAGQTDRARAVLQRLIADDASDLISPKPLVILHAALGDMDSAFSCLERAFEIRDTMLFSLPAVAVYDPLRSDPRFDRLVARVRRRLGLAAAGRCRRGRPTRDREGPLR